MYFFQNAAADAAANDTKSQPRKGVRFMSLLYHKIL